MSYDAKSIYLLSPVKSTIQSAIDSFNIEWLPYHSSHKDLLLYHYTSSIGFKGIISSKSIWSTDTRKLKDQMELKYSKEIIFNTINSKVSSENSHIQVLFEQIVDYIKVFDIILYRVFISCFCEEENSPNQWNDYASKGKGYNIGLNFNSNTKFAHKTNNLNNNSYVILRKVIYNPDLQRQIVSNYIDLIIQESKRDHLHKEYTNENPSLWSSYAALESVNIFFDLIMSFKDNTFQKEQKWRLIKVISPTKELINFKDINNKHVHHINTIIFEQRDNEKFFPLREIRIGPKQDKVLSKRNFLRELKSPNDTIIIDPQQLSIIKAD